MRLHHELGGSGPRVLFFNGSGATLEGSAIIINGLREFATVLAHDQRGLGRTGIIDGPFTMAQYALGISFGGMVAQHVAARIPRRIERMVLACTSSGGAGGSSYPLHELYALPENERARRFPTILDTRFTPEFVAQDETARMLLAAPRPTLSGDAKRGLDLQMNARRRHDAYGLLPDITCAVMVAAGATDGIAPPENCRRLADRLPDASYREFTGGHMFMLQDRSATPAMIEFLAG